MNKRRNVLFFWLSGTSNVDAVNEKEINGVYKYPADCKEENCKYHVEWSSGEEEDIINFVVIARNTSALNVGLASLVDKVRHWNDILGRL